jgi:hypothetical protein
VSRRPTGDQDLAGDGVDVGNGDVGVVAIGVGEGCLPPRLLRVVDLRGKPVPEFGDELPGVEAGRGGSHDQHEGGESADIGQQCFGGHLGTAP